MKRLIIVLTVIMNLILLSKGYTQTEQLYCLPIKKARLLVQDAVKKRILDSIIVEKDKHIDLLSSRMEQQYKECDYSVNFYKSRYNDLTTISLEVEAQVKRLYKNNESLQKKHDKSKRANRLLSALLIGAIGFIILNE